MARGQAQDYLWPMKTNAQTITGIIHRANELAKSGAYIDCVGVAQHLKEEGVEDAEETLGDPNLRFQIDLACKSAFHAERS